MENRRGKSRFATFQVNPTELGPGLFGRKEPKGGEGKRRNLMETLKSSSRSCPAWYFIDIDRENQMPDKPPSPTLDRGLTTNIVAAYVHHNQIGADQLPIVISTVHQALAGLGKSKAETEMEQTPAVPIRRSVHQDYVVCLECGWRGKMLKRHLATGHGLTVEQAPSTCHGRVRRMQLIGIGHEVYCQSMLQISPQTWNVWVLEALCCSAVR